jgi:hypothetical protein
MILLIAVSQIVRITGMSYWCLINLNKFWRKSFQKIVWWLIPSGSEIWFFLLVLRSVLEYDCVFCTFWALCENNRPWLVGKMVPYPSKWVRWLSSWCLIWLSDTSSGSDLCVHRTPCDSKHTELWSPPPPLPSYHKLRRPRTFSDLPVCCGRGLGSVARRRWIWAQQKVRWDREQREGSECSCLGKVLA